MRRRGFVFGRAFVLVAFLAMAACVAPGVVLAQPGPDQAEEWAAQGGICFSLASPADNTYLPINDTTSLLSNASNCDVYRVGQSWYLALLKRS